MTLPSVGPCQSRIDLPCHMGKLKPVLKYIISLRRWCVICDRVVIDLTTRRKNGELSGQYEAEKWYREVLPETGTRILMPISTRRRTNASNSRLRGVGERDQAIEFRLKPEMT
ncbi:hypothetical protein FOQG_05702 [Fusarium oxysporum f. sp. raphani 54005]|uniref:Uncharacterized protein n=4 Tax=Fusarium oxysporum TaxID=5507 RepID=X0CP54_FUSOX|nr:hypothetical protein FOZG_06809 [Fusarium oxysporum Fo47]EXA01336.1 hypothetical protein FOWG_01237 [Fusarium oxysporum f. sp. lycopersici MN25]EXA48170.1 hypothetical protein FOVG_05017 [Fusarium oxysporum f. sp. pisi HDV247]EXK92619.1 hypothetical protein FOQG_05702 [Fusarium oxysporum f. sp. raphani 54005]EXL60018.1 hypothetical protein FOCG_03036 [Fusarium oxysporum f. sp. radicis-lycopersici 26381]EXL77061.1 hypothetical protein FOPG_08350 [Fusarium oxysporum f. sp. conglutinans race 2